MFPSGRGSRRLCCDGLSLAPPNLSLHEYNTHQLNFKFKSICVSDFYQITRSDAAINPKIDIFYFKHYILTAIMYNKNLIITRFFSKLFHATIQDLNCSVK